jgi:hypothetical protein
MITIKKGSDVVTLINVFSCQPENQQALVDAWVRATEETLGKLPGIISASLHKSKDGTRVVNYAQWKTSENWERLLEIGKSSYFVEMGKFGKPDAHLYEVCYQIDKTND